jgi:chorismate mutase
MPWGSGATHCTQGQGGKAKATQAGNPVTKCGVCGGGFIMTAKQRLGCFGARDQGRCDNHLTIRRDEVEARVLKALQEKLLNQELFEEFCEEFTREMNRLRMERRASLSSAKRDVERIGTRIKKLLDLMLDDEIAVDEGKTEIKALDARRKGLQAQLETADEPPPLLHPEMAELYRQKVTTLAQALEHPETRTEATEAPRGLIDAIVMTPAEGALRIELKGNLAAMLGATVQSKRTPETEALSLQVSMVAGTRNQQYLEFCWAAAYPRDDPPFHRLMHVIYPVGSSRVYLRPRTRLSLMFRSDVFADRSLRVHKPTVSGVHLAAHDSSLATTRETLSLLRWRAAVQNETADLHLIVYRRDLRDSCVAASRALRSG